jgi:NAD+ synthase (glutamine-hydrolysing)
VLGTRDYARKCGFTEAVVGLSGGIDSAVTAAIAAEALGRSHVLGVLMPSPLLEPRQHRRLRDAGADALGIDADTVPIERLMYARYERRLEAPFAGRRAT